MEKKNSAFDKIVTVILLAICLFLVFLIARHYLGNKTSNVQTVNQQNQAANSNVVNVSTTEIGTSTFIKTTILGADLENSMDTVNLYSSELEGKITAIYLAVGQEIKAGDVIAVVDPSSAGSVYKPTEVKSPIGGTIYSVSSYVGQQVSTSTVLATIGSAGDLEVVANMSERFLSSLSIGMKATFTTSAWPDDPINATVKAISPSVDSSNRTFKVTLGIDAKDSRLKEGMYVKLKLEVEHIENAIVVPTKAIDTYLGENVVYIVENEQAKRVNVTLGSFNDTDTVVTSGLKEGDLLIIAGSVTDQSPVSIVKE